MTKKTADRYLFVSSQGIGNQIEEWSILWWLLEQEKKQIDIYYYFWPGAIHRAAGIRMG